MSCEFLKPHLHSESSKTQDDLYYLDRLRSFDLRQLHDGAWLVLHHKDKTWLEFAVVELFMSGCDGSDTLVNILFHGSGATGSLRECRHTWWGQDGYVFYPSKKTITLALEALSEFFDLD